MIKYFYGPVNSGKAKKAIEEILPQNLNFAYFKATEKGEVSECLFPYFHDIVIGNAQFISEENILLICNWARESFINVYFIGLAYNKNTDKYPSHDVLLRLCDKSIEIEQKCDCGEKAIYNICINTDGDAMLYTENTDTKVMYKAVCPYCYNMLQSEAKEKENAALVRDAFIECYH